MPHQYSWVNEFWSKMWRRREEKMFSCQSKRLDEDELKSMKMTCGKVSAAIGKVGAAIGKAAREEK